jgi:dipeptidyl aminopeptidase/acylaminoacyl peptidase
MKKSSFSNQLFAICFLFSFSFSTSFAQQNLSVEKLWQLGRVSDQQVSPDGKLIIFGVKNYDVKVNKGTNIIYKCDINGGNKIAITNAEMNAFSARFTPDGKKISFLKATGGNVALFEMNLDGKNETLVLNIPGGISGYKYSPKMNNIAFTADVKLDQEVKEIYPDLDKCNARIIDGLFYRHWDAWHDYAYSHLFIVPYSNGQTNGDAIDIMKNEKFDCPLQPNGDDDEFNWNPAGTKLAYDSRKLTGTAEALSTNSDIYEYDLLTQKTMNLSAGNKGYDRNPKYSPNGNKIAWLQMIGAGNESDNQRICVLDLPIDTNYEMIRGEKTSVIRFEFTGSPTKDLHIENFEFDSDLSFYYIVIEKGTKQIYYTNNFRIANNKYPEKITNGDHDYTSVLVYKIGKKTMLLGSRMSISMPTELFTIDPKSKKQTQITFTNQDILNQTQMGKVEKRITKTTDGKDLMSWVIYPPNFDATKKYPTLLYCQGGPQSALSQFFSYRWNFQLMAANGYIVIAPNRRGMPGHGSEWNDAITGDYGGQCMKDYLSAIDDISNELYVNKDKLGAVGASFGGFSVYWLAGNHNKRFKTFIAHCGMFNMESWYGTTEEMYFANNDNKGPYWSQTEHPNNFDASPHKFVKNWDVPMLVIHNEKDFRVPLGQGMEAFTAAQLKGLPSRFLYFPDENHWVTKPQNSVLWQRVFFDWLDRSLK